MKKRNSQSGLLTEAPTAGPAPNGDGESAPAPRAEETAPAPPPEAPEPEEKPQAADAPAPPQPDSPPSPEPAATPSEAIQTALTQAHPAHALSPPSAPVAPLVLLTPEQALQPLEERVRRLEDALAQMQGAPGSDGRGPERAAVQLGLPPPAAIPVAQVAPPAPASTAGMLLDAGKRLLGAAATAVRKAPEEVRRAALFWDAVAEARAIVRMYLDPRYRLSWLGRLVPPLLVLLIVTSGWWVPGSGVPVFGTVFHPLIDKGIDLLLAFVLYKVLAHEARRYRETAPDLPPTLRL